MVTNVRKKLPAGMSDFKEVITGKFYYIDKSLFIKEILDIDDRVVLIPRPRRFGKTLNISMLKYFYDCCPDTRFNDTLDSNDQHQPEDRGDSHYKYLFDSLAIQQTGHEYLSYMGQHPVIFLTFKSLKTSNWKLCFNSIKQLIQAEYAKHYYLMSWPKLLPHEKDYFNRILNLTGDEIDYSNSLQNLLILINRYYHKKVVILIDEYDSPIHAGFSQDYYDNIIEFMRNFLCSALKDTDQYLEKAVLTGILRVAKESIFSGLNNLGVYTILSEKFDDKFGFTENEIVTILEDFKHIEKYQDVQKWYNGYRFGRETIYNPWSIIRFLVNEGKEFSPYWINTSNNEIIETLLSNSGKELKSEMELLIRGESIEKTIDDNIVLKDIYNSEDTLWSFLLMSGYLKQTNCRKTDGITFKTYYNLSIPNKEVGVAYNTVIENFFSRKVGNKQIETMLKALIEGDIKLFEHILRKVVLTIFSYHDFGDESEKVYHALVLGLLVWISDTHEIKSNRESGYGRYDISIIPFDARNIGYIIEFKTLEKEALETVETAAISALNQIEEKKYETELTQRGIKTIKKLAIVFNGKDVYVRQDRQPA